LPAAAAVITSPYLQSAAYPCTWRKARRKLLQPAYAYNSKSLRDREMWIAAQAEQSYERFVSQMETAATKSRRAGASALFTAMHAPLLAPDRIRFSA
jgi:hypothetical protein